MASSVSASSSRKESSIDKRGAGRAPWLGMGGHSHNLPPTRGLGAGTIRWLPLKGCKPDANSDGTPNPNGPRREARGLGASYYKLAGYASTRRTPCRMRFWAANDAKRSERKG